LFHYLNHMGLKIKVKVGEINNLSDARYCAGMGVEMIGFSLEESHAKYLNPAKITEISNWLTGIQIVGEFESTSPEQINSFAKMLPLNHIQLSSEYMEVDFLKKIDIPVILKIHVSDGLSLGALAPKLAIFKDYVDCFLLEGDASIFIDDEKSLIEICNRYNILLGFGVNKDNLEHILNTIKPWGIALKGGIEIRPGLKDFEELAEILDLLEVDEYNV
jgi:phosphoribosylanthranilate isomerase